jgi:hypothetical protein
MSRVIEALLLCYGEDGESVSPTVKVSGYLVDDERHGRVLEFVLPRLKDLSGELAILISASDLGLDRP